MAGVKGMGSSHKAGAPRPAPLPAMGEEEAEAEAQVLEFRWHTEFPGQVPPPALCLDSVLTMEEELGRCQLVYSLPEHWISSGITR